VNISVENILRLGAD